MGVRGRMAFVPTATCQWPGKSCLAIETASQSQAALAPEAEPRVERVVEYVSVTDNASERHWSEALKSMLRVHGRNAVPFVEELQRIKALKLSGDPDGSLT